MMGMYHIGVCKVLYEKNLLPRIIAGSSAGSIVASFIATTKLEDLKKIWDSDSWVFSSFTKKNTHGTFTRRLQRILS